MPSENKLTTEQRLSFVKGTKRGIFTFTHPDTGLFIGEGLMEPAPLDFIIDKRYTVDQLKPILKELGLKLSGNKTELIARIIFANPQCVQELSQGGPLYRRTENGQELVEAFYEDQQQERREERHSQKLVFYERDLMDWRKSRGVVIGIQIKPSQGIECANAKEYAGCYKLEDAPDYPFGPCELESPEFEGECCCWWAAILEGEEPEGGWKNPVRWHSLAGPQIEILDEPVTEESVRGLAEFLNTHAGTNIGEESIQASLTNAGIKSPTVRETQSTAFWKNVGGVIWTFIQYFFVGLFTLAVSIIKTKPPRKRRK